MPIIAFNLNVDIVDETGEYADMPLFDAFGDDWVALVETATFRLEPGIYTCTRTSYDMTGETTESGMFYISATKNVVTTFPGENGLIDTFHAFHPYMAITPITA